MSILAVLILVAISFTSAISMQTADEDEKLGSPLFRIRTQQAIKEKINEIKAKFIENRVFLFPFHFLMDENDLPVRFRLVQKPPNTAGWRTCWCPL